MTIALFELALKALLPYNLPVQGIGETLLEPPSVLAALSVPACVTERSPRPKGVK